jgi:4-hydroxy-4-methyl-2-oxoglutarate aldolase
VTVGGVTVQAGDFVIGDGDGVMVVEREKIESLIGPARKKVQDEAKRIAAIKDGNTAASWLDGALRAAGILQEGEAL